MPVKVKKRKDDRHRKLCFGSRIDRTRLIPVGGKPYNNPGPGSYDYGVGLLKKLPNRTGYTLLASKTPRDKDFRQTLEFAPPVGTYDIDFIRSRKQCSKPFGSGGPQLAEEAKYVTPAPGTYSFFKRNVRVCTAFAHDRITVPLVRLICAKFNMARCALCEETPKGDYWHKDLTNQDMCRPCMEQELAKLKQCATKVLVRHRKKLELAMYRLVRYCDFYHDHNGVKAAIQHLPYRDMVFKLRKENYLSSFGL